MKSDIEKIVGVMEKGIKVTINGVEVKKPVPLYVRHRFACLVALNIAFILVVAVFVMVVMKYFSNVAWTMFAGGMVLSVMLDIYYDIRKCWDLQEK